MITTRGSRRYPRTMCGKEDSDDSTGGRQPRCYLRNPYAVLKVPARPARDVTVLDHPTSRVLPVARPWKPCEQESVGAHRPWTTHHAWNPSQQVRPHRAPTTCGPSLPACPLPPSSIRLRRQTVPSARRSGAEDVSSVNHTVSRYICESAQHGFVGQVWSGRVVSIRPTRYPLRPSVRRDEP